MALDGVKNFAKANLTSGIAQSATSLVVDSGQGARFPAPSTDGEFNVVVWNATDYPDPADDPNVEIVRVTARTTDTMTVTRAQEGTADAAHNTGGKLYKVTNDITAKMISDIRSLIHDAAADTPLDADEFGFWDAVDGIIKKITWTNLKVVVKAFIMPLVYPIGSVYINATDNTNPATLLGFTSTWVVFAAGKLPVGINSADTDFDTAEETGGSKTSSALIAHAHTGGTGNESADHTHSGNTGGRSADHTHNIGYGTNYVGGSTSSPSTFGAADDYNQTSGASADHTHAFTSGGRSAAHTHSFTSDSSGSGASYSIMNPYVVVYMWKRTV